MYRRLRLIGLLYAAAFAFMADSCGEQVVFSEVMYHPADGLPEFIEIENLTATPFDIAEWQFSKGVSFSFPKFSEADPQRSFLKAFDRIVVCGVDPITFRQQYALDDSVRIFGPWTGKLSNGGERITLEDKNGVSKCSLRYDDEDRWPVSADGSGHSLVLTDTSRAIDDYRWWQASLKRGGSPGLANPSVPAREERATINEIHFTAEGQVDWIELYNPGEATLDLTGHALSLSPDLSNILPISGILASKAHASWTFESAPAVAPSHVYLVDPNFHVIDAIELRWSVERPYLSAYSDGVPTFYLSELGTQDSPNDPVVTAIVINELMVERPLGGREGEFIELYNKGTSTVDLSGWQFDHGVSYTFPPNTTLASGAYLAIAADAVTLTESYPGARILGNYEGSLANSGEYLRLVDTWENEVDALHYQTGGDWPQLARGQGSSLELRHPTMDNASASAWADSDESTKSTFQTFTFTEDYLDIDSGNVPNESDYRELHLHAVGDAHLALRNLSLTIEGDSGNNLLPNQGTAIVGNGDGATGWLCQGNHHGSFIQDDVFHLVSTGHGDVKANRCETDVTAISQGDTLTFTTEARWISGKPTLIVQTWDRTFGNILRLPVPANLGTPGAANSTVLNAPAPSVSSLRHDPAVPTSSDPVRISAQVLGATEVRLWHRLDSVTGESPWQSTPMASEGNGHYAVTLTNYQTEGAIVQFYVDASKANIVTKLPRDGAERPAMWIVDDTIVPNDLRTQRFILSASGIAASGEAGDSEAFDYRFPRLSNQYFNATFISNERDIIYNCEFRKSGSPWTRRDSADFSRAKWKTPGDRPFRGYTKRALDNDINSPFRPYHNRLTRYWLYLLGHPASENEFVRVIFNGEDPILREDVEPIANDFLKRNWEDGQLGELYRIDDEWLFLDDWDFLSGNASWTYKDTDEPERYHSEWMKRSRETEYDYTAFIDWVRTISEDTFSQEQMEALADIDFMAANAAVRGWIDDWDTLTRGRGKNGYFYRRVTDNRWMLLQWDSDGAFRDPDAPFLGSIEGVPTFFGKPYVQQRFKLYLGELVDHYTHNSSRLTTWFQCEEEASTAYETISGFYQDWNEQRVAYAQDEIGESLSTVFVVDSPDGPVTSPLISLSGESPYNAFSIRIPDQPEAVARFTSPTTWELSGIVLDPGNNALTLQLFDHQGNLLTTQQTSVVYNDGRPDQDGDGLSDSDEAVYNTSPTNPDTDGDGAGDGAEVLAGTDPLDANSVLRLSFSSFEEQTGEATLSWPSVAGKTYQVETNDSLDDATWTAVRTLVADGLTSTFNATFGSTEARRFYRVSVVQP